MAAKKEKTEETVAKVGETAVAEEKDDGRVEIAPLFYDPERYKLPVSVIVNGKKCIIPRGKAGIRVPKAVKEVLESSAYQRQMATDYMKSVEGVRNLGEY